MSATQDQSMDQNEYITLKTKPAHTKNKSSLMNFVEGGPY